MVKPTQTLNLQADRLEQTLAEFGVSADIFAGQVLPRLVSFWARLAPGQRLRDLLALHAEVALALGVPQVLIQARDGYVAIDVPRSRPRTVSLHQLVQNLRPPPARHTVLLGIAATGSPLMLYLPSPTVAHVLVTGMTGCGKTELLRSMVTSLVLWGKPRDMLIYLVDPKQRKLAEVVGLPGIQECHQVSTTPGLLERLLHEMERRDNQNFCSPRLYVVIDELADLLMVGGKAVEAALTRLVQRGREAGIHIIASTQRPSATVVQGVMKANFPVRICGAVNCSLDAVLAAGVPRSGAERLLGKGDMLLVTQGQAIRFQACLTSAADIQALSQGRLLEEPPAEPVRAVVERLRQRLAVQGPGRPAVPPSEAMISFATDRLHHSGRCSQRALRQWHKQKFGTDINPPRAAAAIKAARRRVGSGV